MMYVLIEILSIIGFLSVFMICMHFFGKLLLKTVNFRYTFLTKKDPLLNELLQQKFIEIKRQYPEIENVKLITFHSERLKKHRMGMYNVFSDTIIINTASAEIDELYGMLGHEITHAMTKDKQAHSKMQKISNLIFLSMANNFLIFVYLYMFFISYLNYIGKIQSQNYEFKHVVMSSIVSIFCIIAGIFIKKMENKAKKAFYRTREANHYIEYMCDQGSRIIIGEDFISPFFSKTTNPDTESHPGDLKRVLHMKMNNFTKLEDVISEINKVIINV